MLANPMGLATGGQGHNNAALKGWHIMTASLSCQPEPLAYEWGRRQVYS